MKRALWVGLLAFASAASAGEAKNEAVKFHANARVILDDQGVPQQVQAGETLPEAIRALVEQRVMTWRFEPAQVNGVPMAGVTHVFLNACLAPLPGDGMSLAMNYRNHGPGYAGGASLPPPPRYPARAARDDKEGSFRVVTRIETDGRAKIESIETVSGSLKVFEPALREWVASIRYLPEQVAGMPIATRVAYPVTFAIPGGSLSRLRKERREADLQSAECQAATGQDGNAPRPVVLDSPFKLRDAG